MLNICLIEVGYGDISCKTYLGKSLVLFSLLSGLVNVKERKKERKIDLMLC